MLNTFPDLLAFGFFAPTLLRIAAALVFFYGAWAQYSRLAELSHVSLPVVGRSPTIIWLSIAVHAVIGAMLFFGYYTQIAALLAILGCIKGLVWAKKYPRLFPLCRVDYALVLVICLSLLLSGAGAFAQDLPL